LVNLAATFALSGKKGVVGSYSSKFTDRLFILPDVGVTVISA
jgi:hypothetical protein